VTLNKKNVLKSVKDENLKKGELTEQHSGSVIMTKLENQKNVTPLSIHYMHKTKSGISKGRVKIKRMRVLDNKYTGRVDMKDQLLMNYLIQWKHRSGIRKYSTCLPSLQY
jgi:hypothetical protein